MKPAPTPTLSIITPAFNESKNLPLLYQRLLEVLEPMNLSWEWLIVDDHSADDTFEVSKKLIKKDRRIRAFRLSQNCGSLAAIFCGIEKARGECAVVLAADLQDPPEIVQDLIANWKAGAQIVWAVRRLREGQTLLQGIFSKSYYWILRNIAKLKDTPADGADFFLLDRVVINAVQLFPERNVSVFSLLSWIGFRQAFVKYEKKRRQHGKSGWTLAKKCKLVVDSFISFSSLPLRLMSYTGSITALLGVFYATVIILRSNTERPHGWASLIVVVLIIGGIQMLMLGVLGEYIWRILEESRRRPRYTIEGAIEESTVTGRGTSVYPTVALPA